MELLKRVSGAAPGRALRGWVDAAGVFRVTAILCLVGAGSIHVAQISSHFQEWPAAGWFFVAAAVAQLLIAGALVRTASVVAFTAATLVALATLEVWSVSRFVGLPLGPGPGIPEAVSRPDVIAGAMEVATVIACVISVIWGPGRAKGLGARSRGLVLLVVAALAVGSLTWWGLQPVAAKGCGAHEAARSETGPLVPVFGHSALPPTFPRARVRPNEAAGIVVGLLRNCGGSPARLESLRLINVTGNVGSVRSVWVVRRTTESSAGALSATELRASGRALPGVRIPPTDGPPRYEIVVEIGPEGSSGAAMIDSFALKYSEDSSRYDAAFATVARLRVVHAGKHG